MFCLRDIPQFIDVHCDNPELSPASIAAYFNTSLRKLYRLVGAVGWTPASLIWSQRLERAHDLLAQSAYRAPIIQITLSCGIKDGAHFSRAYRKAFGHSPKIALKLAVKSIVRKIVRTISMRLYTRIPSAFVMPKRATMPTPTSQEA